MVGLVRVLSGGVVASWRTSTLYKKEGQQVPHLAVSKTDAWPRQTSMRLLNLEILGYILK